MGLIDRIQAKLELFRLEQRYTRRRNRRSTFVSNAVYVDGEYIYNTPNTTGSSTESKGSSAARSNTDSAASPPEPVFAHKRMNRWSSMPGFSTSTKRAQDQEDWRSTEYNVREVR